MVITLIQCHQAIMRAMLVNFLRSFLRLSILLWDKIQQVLTTDPLKLLNRAAFQRITVLIQLKILRAKKPYSRFRQTGGIEEEQLRSYPALLNLDSFIAPNYLKSQSRNSLTLEISKREVGVMILVLKVAFSIQRMSLRTLVQSLKIYRNLDEDLLLVPRVIP